MRFILFLLACLIVGPLQAEIFGNVEYGLPKKLQSWTVNHIKTSLESNVEAFQFKRVDYSQSGQSKKPVENFSVIVKSSTFDFFPGVGLKSPLDLTNEESIRIEIEEATAYKHYFKEYAIAFNLLESDSQSILVDWSLSVSGKEKVHGVSRFFSTPDETTILTYETKRLTKLKDNLSAWIKVLKKAKLAE